MFENRVLSKIFEPKRGESKRSLERRLHNQKLHDLYPTTNIIWLIKSRGIWWAGHVAYMGEGRNAYSVRWGNLMENTTLKT
jgi:hypothetical protein